MSPIHLVWKPIAATIGAVLLCACLAFGQSTGNPHPSRPNDPGNYKITAHSNLVFLPTGVQSKKGEIIYGLTAEQFIVEDNGVPQAVQVDEDPDSWGLSLVMVVQCGRSAPAEFPKLKGLSAMIDAMVGGAPHEVAVIAYGERPYVLGDFSAAPDAVPRALAKLALVATTTRRPSTRWLTPSTCCGAARIITAAPSC